MEFEFNKTEDAAVESVVTETISEPVAEEIPVEEVVIEQPKKKSSKDGGLVALYSPKKVTMDGVPMLHTGINHISKDDADKWLAAKDYVRLVEESK